MKNNKLIILVSTIVVLIITIVMNIVISRDIDSFIRINENLNNSQELIKLYKIKLEKDICNQSLHYKLLNAYFSDNHQTPEAAINYYKDIKNFKECKEIYYYANGYISRQNNDVNNAIRNFKLAINQTKKFKGTYNSLGYLYQHNLKDFDNAIKYYKLSIDSFPDLNRGLVNLIGLYFSQDNLYEISKLINDEKYGERIPIVLKLQYYKKKQQYLKFIYYFVLTFISLTTPLSVISAFVLMMLWIVLITQFKKRNISVWKICIAVLFGFLSTLVTLYFSETTPEITTQDTFFGLLLLFFAKVGPIEEFSKIFLVILLISILRIRDKPLDIVIYGSLIGLGFATMENMQYFSSYGLNLIFSRFVFSILLHISLTGILSFTIYMFYQEKIKLMRLIKIFVLVALVHGGYDFVLSMMQYSTYIGIFQLLVYATYGLIAFAVKYYINLVLFCIKKNNININISVIANIYFISVILAWALAMIFSTYTIGLIDTIKHSLFNIVLSLWVINYTYSIFKKDGEDMPNYLITLFNFDIKTV